MSRCFSGPVAVTRTRPERGTPDVVHLQMRVGEHGDGPNPPNATSGATTRLPSLALPRRRSPSDGARHQHVPDELHHISLPRSAWARQPAADSGSLVPSLPDAGRPRFRRRLRPLFTMTGILAIAIRLGSRAVRCGCREREWRPSPTVVPGRRRYPSLGDATAASVGTPAIRVGRGDRMFVDRSRTVRSQGGRLHRACSRQ